MSEQQHYSLGASRGQCGRVDLGTTKTARPILNSILELMGWLAIGDFVNMQVY